MLNEKNNNNNHQNNIVYDVKNLNLWYGDVQGLKDINLTIRENQVTAIIGPSGCGKSTFIKTLNRMVDNIPAVRTSGEVLYYGTNIFSDTLRVEELRTSVGMVFQKPNPFPKSIYENVVYGPKIHGISDKKILSEITETSLKSASLWEEVKDRLHTNAYGLSGGQQQRLCIARSLAIQPEVLLMDEPTSALDPIATNKIEELINELKKYYTIVIVTHNMQQAARIADSTAFFLNGELVEHGPTSEIFTNPRDKRTDDYISGRFG